LVQESIFGCGQYFRFLLLILDVMRFFDCGFHLAAHPFAACFIRAMFRAAVALAVVRSGSRNRLCSDSTEKSVSRSSLGGGGFRAFLANLRPALPPLVNGMEAFRPRSEPHTGSPPSGAPWNPPESRQRQSVLSRSLPWFFRKPAPHRSHKRSPQERQSARNKISTTAGKKAHSISFA